MQRREVTIRNRHGVHSRAAAKLVSVCQHYQSTITLAVNGRRADGRHLIAVLLLSASMGTQVSIETLGPDEAKAMQAVTRLIADGFGEKE
jgi:phosphocarrier protein